MQLPSPILPIGHREPAPRSAAATPTELPVRQGPADEGFVAGFRRRLQEFVVDLRDPREATAWATIALVTGLLIYSYWPGMLNAHSSWSNPQYQHGWVVPVINLLLLFWRRQPVSTVTTSARLTGFALLAGSLVLRIIAANYRIVTVDMYTFVPALAGVFLLAGGWGMFMGRRWRR